MSGKTEPTPWGARLVRRADLFLFSLNLAWMSTWYLLDWTSICRVLPLRGDVDEVFHWHFWMPEPGFVLRQVVYSFALCIPFALVLFLLARVSLAGAYLRVIAGAFAITGFPFYALCVGGPFSGRFILYPGYELELTFEAVAVLVCAVLYYLRRWPVPTAASLLLLLLHFNLWAWLTGNHVGPFALIGAFPAWFKMSALQIGLRVCIIMMYHNGFPVIGFLSTLGSSLDLKLSSDRASRATGPA